MENPQVTPKDHSGNDSVKGNKNTNANDDPTGFEIESLIIDLSEHVPDPIPVLSIDETLIGSPGNILTVKASAKAGKSFVVSAIAAAFIKGECLKFKGRAVEGKSKIAYLDTEQSKPYVYRIAKRIHKLAGIDDSANDPRLKVYYLKEQSTEDRYKALEMAASDPELGLIILDGVVDIMVDFNDLKESTRLRDYILKIVGSNDLILINVIHTNKNDSNSRGHAGAFLEQKSETVLMVRKEGEAHRVEPAYSRDKDSTEFYFKINDETKLPEIYDNTETQSDKRENEMQNNLEHCLNKGGMTYTKLVKDYMQYSGKAERTAKLHIGKALKIGILEKDENDNYNLMFKPVENTDPF